MVRRTGARHTLRNVQVDGPVETAELDPDAIGPLDDEEPTHRAFRSLAALAREVDFTVFVPGDEQYLGYLHQRDDGPVVEARPAGGRPGHHLRLDQSRGAGMADPAEWEPIELPDGTAAWWWSPEHDPEQGHLRFERAGTQIWIQGRGRDKIRTLAATLEPIAPRTIRKQRP